MTIATKPLLFVALAVAAPAAAKEDIARPQVYQDLVQCRAIADTAQRLACFDAAAAKMEQAAEAKDIVILDRAEVKKTRRSLFGFLLPKLPFFDDEDEEKFTDIETTFASVTSIGHGNWQFEIPDGGVWQTTEGTKSYLRVGQKVRLKQGAVGGFLMQIGNGGYIRVRRVS